MTRGDGGNLVMTLLLTIVMGVFLALIFLLDGSKLAPEKPSIAVSIYPLKYVAESIVGDEVDVKLLLPSGTSPHGYDVPPEDASGLRGSDLMFRIGMGLDPWAGEAARDASLTDIDVSNFVPIAFNDGGKPDPHYWLTLPNMILIAGGMEERLSYEYPDLKEIFAANTDQLIHNLRAADAEVRASMLNVESPFIVTYHGGFQYFADEYGLRVLSVYTTNPGQEEPRPEIMGELNARMQAAGARAIYSEPQFDASGITAFAGQTYLIGELDPIGGKGEAVTFEGLMKQNARTIAELQ